MKNTRNNPPPFTGNQSPPPPPEAPLRTPPVDTNSEEQAFCVKCKTKHPMINHKKVKLKNNRDALQGNCKNCNTTVFKLTKKEV